MLCPHRGLHGLIEAQFLEKKSLNYESLEMKNIAKDGFRENDLLIRLILFPSGYHYVKK